MSQTNHTRVASMMGSLLTMLFIVLKLFGVLHWSWLWITSPLWIVVSVALLFTLVLDPIIAKLFSKRIARKRAKRNLDKNLNDMG